MTGNATDHPSPSQVSSRHRTLDQVLEQRLRRRGWRLEFYSETSAMIAHGRPVNHLTHALLTVLTGGFWLIVWLFAIGFGGEKREMIFVHPSGFPEVKRVM